MPEGCIQRRYPTICNTVTDAVFYGSIPHEYKVFSITMHYTACIEVVKYSSSHFTISLLKEICYNIEQFSIWTKVCIKLMYTQKIRLASVAVALGIVTLLLWNTQDYCSIIDTHSSKRRSKFGNREHILLDTDGTHATDVLEHGIQHYTLFYQWKLQCTITAYHYNIKISQYRIFIIFWYKLYISHHSYNYEGMRVGVPCLLCCNCLYYL